MARVTLCVVLSLSVLTGCATPPHVQGQKALRQGLYDEAAGHFEEVLIRDAERLDALAGLGISRYKLGDFDEAVDALERVVARAPKDATAQLYLGLSYLQKGDYGRAEEHLMALLDLKPEPRLSAQIDRALRLLRLEPPSDELRGFLAASLEDEAEWAREVSEARREARLARQRGYAPSDRFTFVTRSGRLVRCF